MQYGIKVLVDKMKRKELALNGPDMVVKSGIDPRWLAVDAVRSAQVKCTGQLTFLVNFPV